MAEDLEQLLQRAQDKLRGYPLPPERPPSRFERITDQLLDLLDHPGSQMIFFALAIVAFALVYRYR